MDRATVK